MLGKPIQCASSVPSLSPRNASASYLLCALLILYSVARLLELRSGGVPTLTIVALQVVPSGLFAFLHGAIVYRLRGILTLIGLCVLVGSFFESISLRSGFPFGHYYFTGVMGPQLFHLPVLLVLAYIGMGYASWVVGLAILGTPAALANLSCKRLVALPLISSFVMVAWDLAMDPVWSTVGRAWIWQDGGRYFGVPVSNFLGWYLTVFIIYSLFALYLRWRELPSLALRDARFPVLFYALTAASNLLHALPVFRAYRLPPVVPDAGGHLWRVSDILAACALISLYGMFPFALIAWERLRDSSD